MPVDASVYADQAAAADGQSTFLVVLHQKADLSQVAAIWWSINCAQPRASQCHLLEKLAQRVRAGHVSRVRPILLIQ